jgi:hypothetical protein
MESNSVSHGGSSRSIGVDPRVANAKPHEMHAHAVLLFEDTVALPDRGSAGPYILMMLVIELALKGYLHARGRALDDLRKDFGHDLVSLLNECRSSGLAPSHHLTSDVVARLNEAGTKAKIRYDFDFHDLPLRDDLISVGRAVLDDTKPALPSLGG